MAYNELKIKNIYFYFYMVVPLLCPIVYFLTTDAQIAIIVFFVTALICAELDLKEIANVHRASVPKFVNPAISVLFFPPLYVYSRSQFAGVKSSNRWGWFFVYIAIALSCIPAVGALAYSKELKVDACELTTSILKDKGSNVTCLVVEDVKEITDKHYRAKAVLSNGMGMPIVIEERDDGYIYVTLTPLSDLFDLFD
ncbi:hypothetical protein IQ206_13960 [Escherichia coli]|uniref:Uncharacterized protein n=1 Tax=Escherichia marmotae TaxID=1499973 RepID=A0A370V8Y7_9ESCH|nr:MULTISPECIES: hypothetical protein [Escherichia]EEW8802375.1 hypothetical protein [Escherichia coli]EFC2155344.1 hypothetical protein [Escherichia coli]EFD0564432.1 hypothetical protein [Escherichia coli]EFM6593960.1 hypothetical protein [Escherichia coli]EHU9777377.1 hypothetical protein [Escherichia coli]